MGLGRREGVLEGVGREESLALGPGGEQGNGNVVVNIKGIGWRGW